MKQVPIIICPKCNAEVNVVDGEYARHYVIANVICTMSKREVILPEEPDEQGGDPALD